MRPTEACIKNNKVCENFTKYPVRCDLCINQSFFTPVKTVNKTGLRTYKKSSRMGAKFEESLQKKLNKVVESGASLTPNSGAGDIKGDINIDGLVKAKGELKTKVVPKLSRGSLSFTIQKEWLEKQRREAADDNREFWFLAFRFLENEDDTYIIIDEKEFESWLYNLIKDRTKAQIADSEIKAYRDRYRASESKVAQLEARIKELESCKEFYESFVPDDKKIN